MSRNDAPEPRNRSGGGIVFGGGTRSGEREVSSLADLVSGLRRRWASGIAVVTAAEANGSLRGVTVSSLMVVSIEPPMLAVSLTATSSFQELAIEGANLGVSFLDADHGFSAERFAGRAPLPDARFAGVPHRIVEGVPILEGSPGWCVAKVAQRQEVGDHVLLLLEAIEGELGTDTDDPLLNYEGRYRRLEAG